MQEVVCPAEVDMERICFAMASKKRATDLLSTETAAPAPTWPRSGPVATTSEVAASGGSGTSSSSLKTMSSLCTIEKGVPEDAAAQLSADLRVLGNAEAATDGDDDDGTLECTVMKRGNYWPYFWSQRLLVVESRSLLYFATSVPPAGAAPRGFFPLQPNTRLLLSFDRVCLYGRTEGLLLGIFNAPIEPPASNELWWSLSQPVPSSSAAPLRLNMASSQVGGALSTGWVSRRPLHLPKQSHELRRPRFAASGNYKYSEMNHTCVKNPDATAGFSVGSHTLSACQAASASLILPLSYLLAPFRSLFSWFFSSAVKTYQSSIRRGRGSATHAKISVTECTTPSSSPRSQPPFQTTSRALAPLDSSMSSSIWLPRHTFAYSLASPFSTFVFPSTTPVLCSTDTCFPPTSPSADAPDSSPALSSPANGRSVSLDPSSETDGSYKSASSSLHPVSTTDLVETEACQESPTWQSSAAESEFLDAEDYLATHFNSAGASSPVVPHTSDTPASKSEEAVSSSSFLSLPATPSVAPLSCTSSLCNVSPEPTSSAQSLTPGSGASICTEPPVDYSPSRLFFERPSAWPSRSSSPTSSLFTSFATRRGLTSRAPASAGDEGASLLRARLSPSIDASSTPAAAASQSVPSRARGIHIRGGDNPPSPTTESSSASLPCSACPSCSTLASPAAGLCRAARNEARRLRAGAAGLQQKEPRRDVAAEHWPLLQPGRAGQQCTLHQAHQRLQQVYDVHRTPVQLRQQAFSQWSQMDSLFDELHLPSGGMQASPEFSQTVPGDAALEPQKHFRNVKAVQFNQNAAFRGSPVLGTSGDSKRTSHCDEAEALVVAPEASVMLACSQEVFAKEFNRAPNPKFLFEFVDRAQQRRVACAVARAILRIRLQAQRKQQQRKQRLQDRLNDGLVKCQREKHEAQQRGRRQRDEQTWPLPRGSRELQVAETSLPGQAELLERIQRGILHCPPQHLQTVNIPAYPTFWPTRSVSRIQRFVQGFSLSGRSIPLAAGWGSAVGSAEAEAKIKRDLTPDFCEDPYVQGGLNLPRLLRESADTEVLPGPPRAVPPRRQKSPSGGKTRTCARRNSTASRNTCVAVATGLERIIGPESRASRTPTHERNRRAQNGVLEQWPCSARRAVEVRLNVKVSERSVENCLRKLSLSADNPASVAAAERSHSGEEVSNRARGRLVTCTGDDSGEVPCVKSAVQTRRHASLGNSSSTDTRPGFHYSGTALTPSQCEMLGHDSNLWALKGVQKGCCTEAQAGGEMSDIVSELLEMLLSPEVLHGVACTAAADHCAADCFPQPHRGKRKVARTRCRRKESISRIHEPHNRRQLSAEGCEFHMRQIWPEQPSGLLEAKQRQVADASTQGSDRNMSFLPPDTVEPRTSGGQHSGEMNLQKEQRYARLIEALTRLREIVLRNHADYVRLDTKQRCLLADSAVCDEGRAGAGLQSTGFTKCPRTRSTASTTGLQRCSDAPFGGSQNSKPEMPLPNGVQHLRRSRVTSLGRDGRRRTTVARSDACDGESLTAPGEPEIGRGTSKTGGVSGLGEACSDLASKPAFASTKEHELQQAALLKRVHSDKQSQHSASLLQASSVVPFSQADIQDGTYLIAEHQRARAASLLLLQQKEQLERLKSVVDFLMRERELQSSLGYQVDEAELQHQWEEEQRRFEVERQRPLLDAARLLEGELNACKDSEKPHLVAHDTEAQVPNACKNEQPWDVAGLVEAASIRKKERAASPESQRPAMSTLRQGRLRQPKGSSRFLHKTATERFDRSLRGGKNNRRVFHDVSLLEARLQRGDLHGSSHISTHGHAQNDSPHKKGVIHRAAALSLKDSENCIIESDTLDHENEINQSPVTAAEPRVIFRISTPPSSSRESNAKEFTAEPVIQRELSALRLRHQSSY